MENNTNQIDPTKGHSKYFLYITILFVAVLMISNTVATKLCQFGPFFFTGAIMIFPLSYIFGDILTEVYGYRTSRRVIWVGFAASVAMSASFWIIQHLPGEAQWQGYAGDAAYGAILGGVSSGGIIVASLA